MNAGKLNRRVVLVQRSSARDAAGGVSDVWNDIATVWASIDIQYSSLTYETSTFIAKATYRITLRWSRSLRIAIADRIRFTDPATNTVHLYEVESIVNNRMLNKEVMVLAWELDAGL